MRPLATASVLAALFAPVLFAPASGQGTVVGTTQVPTVPNIGPGVPVFPCINPNEHYQGEAVTLLDSFLSPGVASGVHVDAIGGPAGEFGFFLIAEEASTPLPISQGLLCLVLPVARFNQTVANNTGNLAFNSLGQFDPAGSGVFQNLSGTAPATGFGFDVPLDLPPPFGPGQVQTGETYWVQLWYRDQDANGAPASNFSSAIEIEIP